MTLSTGNLTAVKNETLMSSFLSPAKWETPDEWVQSCKLSNSPNFLAPVRSDAFARTDQTDATAFSPVESARDLGEQNRLSSRCLRPQEDYPGLGDGSILVDLWKAFNRG